MQAETENLNAENSMRASAICHQVQGRVLTGKPVAQILSVAKELSADLIVIGRQRYHVMPFPLSGKSNMQPIAGAMDVPTLIVPA
jgi:nucleotide-binding universal stress UspA family protein